MRVVALHVYPVKSARAVSPARARLDQRGFEHDRRWLVVDDAGAHITQREESGLATISAQPTAGGLHLSAPGAPDLFVETPSGRERIDVTLFKQPINAALAGEDAHAWLSRKFGKACRLVHMDDVAERVRREPAWREAGVPVSLADNYPILLATTGSLAALNADIVRHGAAPVPMARFRPNLVVDCDDPWREDTWKALRLGNVEIEFVRPCDRCTVPQNDQGTGQPMGAEPSAGLVRLRRSADPRMKKVVFGWYAFGRRLGDIEIGDSVEVLEERPEAFPILPAHEATTALTA
jgi:uncharacterized protein